MAKKGQAAMEFLMTYGWAILVVLIVIAALAYFGVLDPSNVLPDKCTFPVTLTCDDFLVNTQGISLNVINNAGKGITISRVNVTSTALNVAPGETGWCSTNVAPGTIATGDNVNLLMTMTDSDDDGGIDDPCTFAATGKQKDKYSVKVHYVLEGSNFEKTLGGELLSKRES